jgi:tetratricopeptide (TPR) repeat protein
MRIHPPGTRLGQFEVVGYPVMGDVTVDYTCLDRERSCPTLLKSLRPELLSSRTARNCFAQNGAAWAGLGAHPHIVHCHDLFEPSDSEVYLVLQTVVPERDRDTVSLTSWLLPGRPLPVLQALLFALQIARGLHYVASRIAGFIHGDLKPENVLVSGGRLSQAHVNRLRVTDFGLVAALRADGVDLSKLLEKEETAVTRLQWIDGVVGTPIYMAPELWRGKGASTASDVYALGCILYRMLVGRHPVGGDKTQHLRSTHCMGNVRPLPASLAESVHDLIARCLALEPGDRYQSWKEVETAIAVAYEGTVKHPVPAAETTQGPTASERIMEGWFLDSMGCACTEAGSLNTAAECLELALKAGRNEGDQALEATATSNLGGVYCKLGDTQRAIEHHQKALTIVGETGDRSVEGSALCGLGVAYLQLGSPLQAIEYLEKALELARKIGHRQGEMAALVSLGNVYHQMGDLPRSIQYYERELEIARKLGDRRGESAALANLGAVYSALGDDCRAIEYQKQALEIKSEIGDRHAEIASLTNLGNAYRNLGNAQRAFQYYNKSLEIARELGDRRGEAFALNNMGSTHSNLGRMDRAIELHEQALAIFREIGDRRSQGDCLTNLGFIYKSRRDTGRALECCEQALVIDREVGDMFGLAIDSFNMANLLVEQGHFREALPYAEETASILGKIGDTSRAPEARRLVAAIRAELDAETSGTAGTARVAPIDLSQQILQVRRDNPQLTANMSDDDITVLLQQADLALEHGKPMRFVVPRPGKAQGSVARPDPSTMSAQECGAHGEQLLVEGRWSEAERYFLAQLDKGREIGDLDQQARAHMSLGLVYSYQGDLSQAMMLYRHALSTAERAHNQHLIASICNLIGEAYRKQGEYPEALAHYRMSLEIAERMGNEELLAAIHGNIGIVYKNQDKLEQAIQAYERSLEYSTRQGIDRLTAHQYGNLGVVYMFQGRYALALQTLNKSLEISLRLGDQKAVADNYGNLGTVHRETSNYPLAMEMYRKALEIMRELGDQPGTALTYSNLAAVYEALGDRGQALSYYQEALTLFERLGDKYNAAKLHFNLGLFYYQQKQLAQARAHMLEAQAVFEKVGDKQSAQRAAQALRWL